MMMKWDGTINLGHVLTIISILGTGAVAYTSVMSRIANHDIRIETLETRDQQRTNTLIRFADRLDQIAEGVARIDGALNGAKKP